jgi:hypothetical protein
MSTNTGSGGRTGKDDRKQNTLTSLVCHQELKPETRNQKVWSASGDLTLNGEVHFLKQDLTIFIFTYKQPPMPPM